MSSIKRNLGWLLFSQMATWGVSVLILIVGPRVLGDTAFGQMSFAMIYVGFFELVALFGTATYLMKTVARDTASVGHYVFNTLVMKLFLTGLLIVMAIGLAQVLGYPSQTVQLIAIYCLGMLFNSLNSVLVGGLQGLQRMGGPAMWEVARSYVGGVFGLIVLMRGGGIVAYATVFNLALLIPLVANFINLWPELRKSLDVDLALWRRVLAGGVPFFVWSALLVFYGTIDIPMLQAFAGNEAVGWYSLAYRWVSMPAFFAASVATAFFPALSAEHGQISDAFTKMANRALQLVLFVATPAAIGIALISSDFLTLLYGTEFQQAVPLMRILALHVPIVGMDIVLGVVVVAADRQRQWVGVAVVAAIFNPLINLVAIPAAESRFGNGAIGAAATTVATELIVMVGAVVLRPAGVLDRATTQMLGRIVLASVVMVPVVLILGSAPLGVKVLAGGVAYAIASVALRTISISEIRGWGSRLPIPRQHSSGVSP
jgi:O-antigen/teichoic acid export membrane protein